MDVCNFVLLFTLFSSIEAFSFMNALTEFKNNNSFSVVENSGKICDTSKCHDGKCNCCAGYYVWKGFFVNECKKCDCGENFGCTFALRKGKICQCPEGFTQISGACKELSTYPPTTTDKTTTPTADQTKLSTYPPTTTYKTTTPTADQMNKCSQLKCQNGGTCIIQEENAVCKCSHKYTGDVCQTDLTSVNKSGDHLFIHLYLPNNRSLARNSTLDLHFEMKETRNRTLTQILLRLNLDSSVQPKESNCSFITCQNNGKCEVEKGEALCRCTDKYTGKFCEIDKCSLIKCQNGGTCYIRNRKAVCVCDDKFTGDFCETDKCSQIKCRNGGICDVKSGKAICLCNGTYTGDFCEIDECSSIRCQNDGKCEIKNGKAVCTCLDKYTGDYCETDKCSMNQCRNGGKCDIRKGKAICICSDKYIGDFCEIDKCSLMICLNEGKCEIRNQKAVCVCTENFTGDFCEKRNSFLSDGSFPPVTTTL